MLYRGTKVALAGAFPFFGDRFRQLLPLLFQTPPEHFSDLMISACSSRSLSLPWALPVFAGPLAVRGGCYDSAFLIGLVAILLGLLPGVLLQRFSVTLPGPDTGKGRFERAVSPCC